MKFDAPKNVLIAGHRGDPANYPENTLLSFEKAIEKGVEMLETDIRISADGVPVIMHDADVERTTNGKGLVKDMTLSELKALTVGEEHYGQTVPTLSEFLELCAKHENMLIDLEMKVYFDVEGAEAAKEAVDKTIALCEQYGVCDKLLLNSFDALVLEYIYETHGKRFPLHGFYPYDKMRNVNRDPALYLDYACYKATGSTAKEYCDFLISRGIAPCAGSKSEEAVFLEQVAYGCAMFTVNDPETTLSWRNKI